MSLTTTPLFDTLRLRRNTPHAFIVVMETSGAATHHFSTRVVDLTTSGEKFIPLIEDMGDISQKVNLFTKKTSVSNVTIKLKNTPYKVTASDSDVYLSKELADDGIVNEIVQIYLWFDGITDLADCLKVYEGLMQPMEKISPTSLDIPTIDATFLRHRNLPLNVVNLADFGTAQPDDIGKRLPLTYGTFARNITDQLNKLDLAEAVWISSKKLILSDNIVESIGDVWCFDPDLNMMTRIDSSHYTTNVDDSGQATILLNDDLKDIEAHAYIYPKLAVKNNEPVHTTFPFTDENSSIDYDVGEDMTITRRPLLFGPPVFSLGNIQFYFDESFARGGDPTEAYMEMYWDRLSATQINVLHLIYDHALDVGTAYDMEGASDPNNSWISADISTRFVANNSFDNLGRTTATTGEMEITADFTIDGGGEIIATVSALRLRVKYKRPLNNRIRIFAECTGRKYGSWIDDGGRSNSYNEGDLIENPAFIIESILRDELGLANSEIDTSNFDSAGGKLESWDMALSLTELINSDKLFQKFGQQCKCAFFFNSQNLADVAFLDETIETSDDGFGITEIDTPFITTAQGDIKTLINEVKMLYSPINIDSFFGYNETENTTSQTDYKIKISKDVKAPNIYLASVATLLADHITGASGYFKDLNPFIIVPLLDFEKGHWVIGDIIEPDDTINATLKLLNDDFGSGSNAPLFFIFEKKIGNNGLRFKMVKIGETA